MQGHVCMWYYQVCIVLAFESVHRKAVIMVTMEITHAASYAFCI